MVHDAFGKGQFVQHAVLQNERAATLMTAIEEFKKNTPSWTKLQCVVVDKDFTELAVIKAALPGVRVLLCQFHVLKYLREQLASAEYELSPWQKSQLRSVVSLMVFATTEREFAKRRDYMRHILSIGTWSARREATEHSHGSSPQLADRSVRDGDQLGTDGNVPILDQLDGHVPSTVADAEPHPFEIYFRKNWDKCKVMWAAHERQSAVTLGNNTNNRLESSLKHLKDTISSFMGLDECVAAIICYQSRTEWAFDAKVSKIGVVHDPKFDREISLVASLVSRHACDLIFDQYAYAMSATAR
ncbi:hypothetical protein PR001_g4364 [Phytophthora rubi]|uniref:ZSWIM1/3 RNaseH-like domain-containing protein n=1 Tax=Phytophthora rubi TaxID=129364 RepID=A0A6A3MYV1_9STRA|nr:hypothetical protein PR002_g6051 [Phytophthora rubi]KAE9047020.1 hypothetical protein PR001_g4364 [Phytophthora rubi]